MASIKNKYEFYKGFLEALGAQNVAETEYKNEEELRKKILDTMGVEYVFDDVNQTDLFRGKFLEGLVNGGGGGSSDFSTAEVTIIVSGSLASATVLVPNISDSDKFSGIYSDINITRGDSNPITCVLYKGHATFSSQYLITDSSGNVNVDGTDALISGDCSITLSK